ncbi:MAG: class I SAM-dependent methyltransferase [Thiotrichales bacterium]
MFAQGLAALIVLMANVAMLRTSGMPLDPPLGIGAQGVIAALLGWKLRLAWWWVPLNLVMPWALAASQHLALPAEWYLAAFLVLAVIFWSTYKTQVPLFLSNRASVSAIATRLPSGSFRLLDLGSGIGSLICHLAAQNPNGHYDGIENAPVPYLISRLRTSAHGDNTRVTWGDFWHHPLQAYDCVYAFLSPVPMADLWRKAQREMRPGATLISNSFAIPGVEPDDIIEVDDHRQTRLYIYRLALTAQSA